MFGRLLFETLVAILVFMVICGKALTADGLVLRWNVSARQPSLAVVMVGQCTGSVMVSTRISKHAMAAK